MSDIRNNQYFIVKDKHGDEYLCPLTGTDNKNAAFNTVHDDCIEKDVVERYAGNIDYDIV
jgi:hypothetical protein